MQTLPRERRVTVLLIVLNVLCFIASELVGSTGDTEVLIKVGGAYTPYVSAGQYWRLLTSMFLHAGVRHLLNNMLLLAVLGTHLERICGSVRCLLIYLLGGLGGSAVNHWYEVSQSRAIVSVGASGCVYAVLGALLWILLRRRGRVEGLRMQQLLVVLGFSLYYGLVGANVANAAHLGGLLGGFLTAVLLDRNETPAKEDFFSGGNDMGQ